MSVAVLQFSASNCDRDTLYVYQKVLNAECTLVWQDETSLPAQTKGVILPGGFSFGDYLRAGAMAAHRPIMSSVKKFVDVGGPVIGICNGFQILCEAKILPGILLPNKTGRFICKEVSLQVNGGGEGALRFYKKEEQIALPIAHHDGRYFASDETIAKIKANRQIAISYTEKDEKGDAEVNGSREAIAGLFGGPNKNVLGLMPHPERRSEMEIGGDDGLRILQSLLL